MLDAVRYTDDVRIGGKLQEREGKGGWLTQIDIDPAFEEAAEDLDDLGARHVELSREGEAFGHVLRVQHRLGHALLEEAELGALRDGVADGKFDHVVGAGEERDHVVEDARALDVGTVLEVEFLRFKVHLIQGPRGQGDAGFVLSKGEVGQDVLLLVLGEVPEDHHTVRKDKHLAKVLHVRDETVDWADGNMGGIGVALRRRRVSERVWGA
jgi:hypothetical protein